jgi:hypothetical protein
LEELEIATKESNPNSSSPLYRPIENNNMSEVLKQMIQNTYSDRCCEGGSTSSYFG